jgi:hypothetical protein
MKRRNRKKRKKTINDELNSVLTEKNKIKIKEIRSSRAFVD